MNWDDLRFFLAVARTRSLAGAARTLGVNHSTAFRRINRFEEEVGARLFERLPDGYQLTVAGEELLTHAEHVSDEVDRLQLKVLGQDFKPGGTVRLTAPDNIATQYLPAYLAGFCERYPDIEIELDVGAAHLDLTRREADVAIRATATPPLHLVGRRAVELPWYFCATDAYVARFGRPTGFSDLAGHRVVGATGQLRNLAPFRALSEAVNEPMALRCSSLDAMAAIAEYGFAIALLPSDQASDKLQRLMRLPLSPEAALWLLTHPELRKTERIRLLMDHLYRSFRGDARLQ
mgnify:FL=1